MGAVARLQFALNTLAWTHLVAGELTAAAALIEEDRVIAEATGNPLLGDAQVALAAWRGREAPASELIEATLRESTEHGLGRTVDFATYASAVLYNGLGRYGAARDAALPVFERDQLGFGPFVVPELAEAASRTGDTALVTSALEWLSERTAVTPTEWALGIEARIRALLSEGEAAEQCLPRVDHAPGPHPRPRRSWPARICSTVNGCDASAAASTRARSCASPTTCWTRWASKRSPSGLGANWRPPGKPPANAPSTPASQLTAQEAQIARLARDGLSNPEIGARLFISPRTVKYHLSKVFNKLDITSRSQLDRVLPGDPGSIASH